MRIDPDTCDDPVLLAAEVRRLRAVIAAGNATPPADPTPPKGSVPTDCTDNVKK